MDAIQLFFSSLRWQDILDICISSYILLRLYALFRGTAAFRVMVGLAFLWLFQGLALKLGLIVLSYAIQGITAAAAIIIVVIFRNEIRTVTITRCLPVLSMWVLSHRLNILESEYSAMTRPTTKLFAAAGSDIHPTILKRVRSGCCSLTMRAW